MKKIILLLSVFLILPLVLAADLSAPVSAEDQSSFDKIMEPVVKIYNLVKYGATIIATLFLVFVGVRFMTSGNDQAKREQAKAMGTYVVVGLMVIWVAPYVVMYLTK